MLGNFKIFAFHNPEFKSLAAFQILGFQNHELYKMSADFKNLAYENPDMKIFAAFKILAFQNSELRF